jgi:predicted acyl esterase
VGFDGFPAADAEATTFWLNVDGALTEDEPTGSADAAVSYDQDPDQADDLTIFEESGQGEHFSALPPYEWVQPPAGHAGSWVSEPFTEDRSLVGPSRVDLWLSSTAEDTDLEITLSEVRPDGTEFLIQSGWQRASLRTLDPDAGSAIRPVPTFDEADVEALVPGRPTEVSVEVHPVAHVLRQGSRLRISIDSPGGNRVRWKFDTIETAGAVNTVGTSAEHPSRVTLPFLDLQVPSDAPPCPSLRGQPCRQFEDRPNRSATLETSPE